MFVVLHSGQNLNNSKMRSTGNKKNLAKAKNSPKSQTKKLNGKPNTKSTSKSKSKTKPKTDKGKKKQKLKPSQKSKDKVKPKPSATSKTKERSKTNNKPSQRTNKKSSQKSNSGSNLKRAPETAPKAKVSSTSQNGKKSSSSPSIFAGQLISPYFGFEPAKKLGLSSPKPSRDLLAAAAAAAANDQTNGKAIGSIDLFETEKTDCLCQTHMSTDLFATESDQIKQTDSIKIEPKTPVAMISVAVQCSQVIQSQDAQVHTDHIAMRDIGVQTNPLANVYENEPESSHYQFDSYEDYEESDYSYYSSLDDFNMLEDFDDTLKIPDLDEIPSKEHMNEAIIGSPPRNQIYKNNEFHSPESYRLSTNKETNADPFSD